MAALVRDNHCHACGKRHHFTLPSGALSRDQQYEYVCPETGKKAEFHAAANAETVAHPPQGAVQLTPRPGG